MHITLILNAKSTESMEAIRSEVHALREQGHHVEPHITFESGDARRFARTAAERAATLVIAAGGDGTINETVNGIHDHLTNTAEGGRRDLLPPRLAIVPLGTANDFATSLGIPADPAAAMRAAVSGVAVEVDVARVNGRSFINVSTGGFGAEATEETPAEIKRALGALAYLITGVKKFVTLEAASARFVADEPLYDGPFLLFAVGNGRRTGGGNLLTPRAELGDGLLDICILREVSRVEFVTLLPDLRAGRHVNHPAVIYAQVPKLTIEADYPLSVNVDGEPLNECVYHYGISPNRMLLVRPRTHEA